MIRNILAITVLSFSIVIPDSANSFCGNNGWSINFKRYNQSYPKADGSTTTQPFVYFQIQNKSFPGFPVQKVIDGNGFLGLYLAAQRIYPEGNSKIPASLNSILELMKERAAFAKQNLVAANDEFFAPAQDRAAARRDAIAKIEKIEAELNKGADAHVPTIQKTVLELTNLLTHKLKFIAVQSGWDDCAIQEATTVPALDIPHMAGLVPPPQIRDRLEGTRCPLGITEFSEVQSLVPLEYGNPDPNERKAAIEACRESQRNLGRNPRRDATQTRPGTKEKTR